MVRNWLGGYLCVLLKGSCAERFLTLCLYHGIPLSNIRYESHPTAEIPLRYFRRVREIAYKSGCIIEVRKRVGLPFFVRRHRGQTAFAVGIFCAFLLIHGMAARVWNITVIGNQTYTDNILLDFMRQNGYETGMGKRGISCDDLEQLLRDNYDRISWVSARLEGTRLIVEIREAEGEADAAVVGAGNLTAETDGTIVEIVTRSGVPQVKAGDRVAAGQVLISGSVEVHDDAGEVVGVHAVTADGDIRIQRTIVYTEEFAAVWQKRTYQSSQRRPWMSVGGLFLQLPFLHLPGAFDQGLERDVIRSTYQVRLFEDFYLPVYCGFVTERFFAAEEIPYTKEECEELAREHIFRYVEENTRDGELIEADCGIRIDGAVCRVSGELVVTEDAGSLTPIPEEEENAIPES